MDDHDGILPIFHQIGRIPFVFHIGKVAEGNPFDIQVSLFRTSFFRSYFGGMKVLFREPPWGGGFFHAET